MLPATPKITRSVNTRSFCRLDGAVEEVLPPAPPCPRPPDIRVCVANRPRSPEIASSGYAHDATELAWVCVRVQLQGRLLGFGKVWQGLARFWQVRVYVYDTQQSPCPGILHLNPRLTTDVDRIKTILTRSTPGSPLTITWFHGCVPWQPGSNYGQSPLAAVGSQDSAGHP
eukprot:1177346-Prorocentrum_minimum.AAC.2